MAGRLILGTANPSLDSNGAPVPGSTLTFYRVGTTTPQSVYTAVDLLTALANPLTCDAGGNFPPFITATEMWAQSNVGYDVKWSRPGMADVTFLNVYAAGGPAATASITVLNTPNTSGTYTTPVGARQLRIRMMGGGAGGSGTSAVAGVAGLVAGEAGHKSSFGGTEAQGGNPAVGFSGGVITTGLAGTAVLRIQGGAGCPGGNTATGLPGGNGGSSVFGGAGGGFPVLAGGGFGGTAAGASGAGGGGAYNSGSGNGAPGGGAGEYVEMVIDAPLASYAYTVGDVADGGASTQNGGFGAGGLIIVEALF